MHAIIICKNNTVFAKSDFWSKTRQPAPVSPICLYFSRRHQRASTRARKRSSARDATKFNNAELSRFTPANASNSANHLPLSRIEFASDRYCNYVRELALDNQLVASES